MKRKVLKTITLAELLLVVWLINVMHKMWIPVYSDYEVRPRVTGWFISHCQ